MSKKINPKVVSSASPSNKLDFIASNEPEFASVSPISLAPESVWAKITKGWIPYVMIALIGLLVNANTFNHEYALDDDIIVCKNQFVLRGVKGLPEIFKYDVFESFYRSMNTTAQLAGGRYRPFSVATYALEQELIGTMQIPDSVSRIGNDSIRNLAMNGFLVNFFMNSWDKNKNKIQDKNEDVNGDGLYNEYDYKITGMKLRHINNVILYALSVCCIFLFLSTFFFRENKLMALLISLLFLVHPIHTEVVANVKSRDEILSLMFMVLTMHNSFLYIRDKNKKNLIWASLCYIIALLSKEYGATLMIIVPLSLFVYFKREELKNYVPIMGALGATFLVYYLMRSTVVIGGSDLQNTELLNNPFLFATDEQRSATQMFINLKYFLLLLVPTPLSCDYSYNVIPFRETSDPLVLLAGVMLLTFGVLFVRSILKRSWVAFPIAFALLHLFLVNNLFFNIGATMGERLVYHSSLGVCILLVWGVYELMQKLKVTQSSFAYAAIIVPIIALYAIKTIARNPAWKNDIALHLTDVQTYPESTMLNGNACTRLIELSEKRFDKKGDTVTTVKMNQLLDSAKIFGSKSLVLHDKFVNSFLNMGIIMAKQNKMDSASYFWGKVRQLYPHHPQLASINASLTYSFRTNAQKLIEQKNYQGALVELYKAYQVAGDDPALLEQIGGTNYNAGNYPKAKEFWMRAMSIQPNNPNVIQGLGMLKSLGY
jgi:protein O-mannosyl-transferase